MEKKRGRKGFGEELRIKERFADLSEPYFLALKEFLNSKDKTDRKFAISEMTKAYARMIPMEMTGAGGGPMVFQITKEIAEKNGINSTSSPEGDSEGHA